MQLLKFLLLKRRSPLGAANLSPSKKKTAGFTLIELLVGMIIAVLVITPVLGFMLNILQTDRREQAKTNTEQDIQAAADFITRDLQQSVFIYDAQGLYGTGADGIKAQLPTVPNGEPVLVFWKRDFVNDAVSKDLKNQCAVGAADCNDAFRYSLVAYYLVLDTDPNNSWSDTARIERFELKDGVASIEPDGSGDIQYIPNLQPDPGFQFVLSDLPGDTLEDKMNNWEKTSVSYEVDAVTGQVKTDVLLDYIDQPT